MCVHVHAPPKSSFASIRLLGICYSSSSMILDTRIVTLGEPHFLPVIVQQIDYLSPDIRDARFDGVPDLHPKYAVLPISDETLLYGRAK